MPKYVIDNTFGFQPNVHQINSLRQKNALRFIIGFLHNRGPMHNATCHRKNRKNRTTRRPCKFVRCRYRIRGLTAHNANPPRHAIPNQGVFRLNLVRRKCDKG